MRANSNRLAPHYNNNMFRGFHVLLGASCADIDKSIAIIFNTHNSIYLINNGFFITNNQ
jgi:hypothetical protein